MAGTPSGARPVLGRLGRYILVDRLGAGGMAEVFRALALGPEQFQRVVVVKRILPQFAAKPSFVQMFIDEARLCGRLSHPNIIQVYEFGNHDSQYFITMEYVEGRSLGHVLQRLHERKQRISPLIAAEIARQISRGLAYAHSLTAEDGKPLGIIHRDLSPANLLVGYNGAVKVLDFGIARIENRFRSGVTDPGQVKGKSAYLSPEQLTGVGVDHRADIFTLGIALHEMLTGRRLFRAGTTTEEIQRIRSLPIAPPSQINPAVPVRLDAIVLRALRREREERYQNATDLADALEGFLLEHRVSSQALPTFMQSLFGSEIGSERIRFTHEEIDELTAQSPPPPAAALDVRASGSASLDEPSLAVDITGDRPRSFRAGRALLLAGGMALAALTIGLGPRLGLRPAPLDGAASPTPAAVMVAQAPPPAPATPTATDKVTIAIASQPTGALVYEGDSDAPLGQTPLKLVRRRGDQEIRLRLKKTNYLEGELTVVPDADKPAVGVLARAQERRSRARVQRVKNALPIDPFAQ